MPKVSAVTPLSDLPPNEKSFTIDVAEGDTTKRRSFGEFECVCVLNLGQRSAADVAEARMNAGLGAGLHEDTRVQHMVLAQLGARLTAAPEWWIATNGGTLLMDWNVAVEIYRQCIEAEKEWRLKVWGPPKVETTLKVTEPADEAATA